MLKPTEYREQYYGAGISLVASVASYNLLLPEKKLIY